MLGLCIYLCSKWYILPLILLYVLIPILLSYYSALFLQFQTLCFCTESVFDETYQKLRISCNSVIYNSWVYPSTYNTYLIAKKSAYLFKFQKDDKVWWWDWLKFSKVTYYIHTRPHRMTMYIKLKFLFRQLEHFIYNIVIVEARH